MKLKDTLDLTREAIKNNVPLHNHKTELSQLIENAAKSGETEVFFNLNTRIWNEDDFLQEYSAYELSLRNNKGKMSCWKIYWTNLV